METTLDDNFVYNFIYFICYIHVDTGMTVLRQHCIKKNVYVYHIY